MTDHLPESLAQLVTLATQARDNHAKAHTAAEQLALADHFQKVVITELAASTPELEDIQKKIAAADAELAELDEQHAQTQDGLMEILTAERPLDVQSAVDSLKPLLSNYQTALFAFSKGSAEQGQSTISVLQLIELEDQIAKAIDGLAERGIFPEDDAATHARVQTRENHTRKVIDFLQLLKGRREAELSGAV
jgi:predicted  nucleic acid-binding Zn-ribbon protein